MKVIFHIGAGKTGTSSIQSTLLHNEIKLNQQGFKYLGLMLEHAYQKLYDWQVTSGSEKFHTLADNVGIEQALLVLNQEISEAQRNNIHTLIWSNESFLDRGNKILNIIQLLLERKIEIEIIAYVRKYDAWVQSAYVQWGIKHKTYKGSIRPFSKWYKNRNIIFFANLKKYIQKFDHLLTLKNMDGQKEVVQNFLQTCGIQPNDFQILRSNESPKNEEIFLRALFNDHFKAPVLPKLFDKMVLNKQQNSNITPTEYLEKLMPRDEDLETIHFDTSAARETLNKRLIENAETPLDNILNKAKDVNVQNGRLLTILAQIIIDQAIRIDKLENRAKYEK